MTPKEIVRRAVEMRKPERVPIYISDNKDKSDILMWNFKPPTGYKPEAPEQSEWGFVWERLDETMGQPKNPPLEDWMNLAGYTPPDAFAPGRMDGLNEFAKSNPDKYIIGLMGITGFNLMTFIRGFENVLSDLYFEQDNISKLADMVFGFEEGLIKRFGESPVDAVAFFDDWGTQNNLMISPDLWRTFFKPRYKKQFQLVHSFGKHVFFHSCGNNYEIIKDLIEIGADMLNFNQPCVYGIERLGREFGGKVCFVCPVDIQKTAITGTKDDIYSEVELLKSSLGSFNGGLIGLVEHYHELGFISREKYLDCISAFSDLGRY